MTAVLLDNLHALEERTGLVADNESMQLVLTAIRYDLSLDPAKTEKQVKKRMSDFAAIVRHMAKSLKTTPERLTVSMAVENDSAFLNYLAQSSLSSQSKMQLRANRNTVLRYARNFGFSPASFVILDAWEPILAVLSSAYGAPTAIAKDAIGRKRHPLDFSQADFSTWANTALDAGRQHAHVRQTQSAFLTAIRKAELQSHLPRLDLAVSKLPGYKLPIQEMPESLRAQINRIIDSRTAETGITPETQREIIHDFEGFCGYADRILGMDVQDLGALLTEQFAKQFAFWLHNERKCKRTTVVGKLSRMFSALETYPDFAGIDFSWIYGVYRKLRREPESALKERRRGRYLAFHELAAIPGRMRTERIALRNPSPTSLAWRIMEELLLTFLILAQYPPRFVREAVIGVNIFKGPVPKGGPPFTIPLWAEELLSTDPDAQFWQFRYESKERHLFRGLVLKQVFPLLELWLNQYRPLLIGAGDDTGRIFFNRARHPLTSYRLGQYVANLTRRFATKHVTATAIRSSFAYYFRERNPNKDVFLANMQWVQYPTIKMRYDEDFRNQRRSRVTHRKNQYS